MTNDFIEAQKWLDKHPYKKPKKKNKIKFYIDSWIGFIVGFIIGLIIGMLIMGFNIQPCKIYINHNLSFDYGNLSPYYENQPDTSYNINEDSQYWYNNGSGIFYSSKGFYKLNCTNVLIKDGYYYCPIENLTKER